MRLLDRRRVLMAASGKAPLLPPEYQQVEWIGADGAQYINLQQAAAAVNYYSVETIVSWSNVVNRQLHGANSGRYFGVVDGFYQNAQTGTSHTDIVAALNQWQNVKWIKNGNNVSLTVDGETDSRTSTVSVLAYFSLFKLGSASYNCRCKLKTTIVKIGENEYHLIPCYHKSDSIIGMFDTVLNTFFINHGTGTFTKGADVN